MRALQRTATQKFYAMQKTAFLPHEIAFFKNVTAHTSANAHARRTVREMFLRGRAARETAVFVPNTRKFACTILGNAYYDRMKRVNPRRVKMITGG
jgi:hypothetical protein